MPRTAILIVLIAVSASVVCNAERAESTPAQDREIYNAGAQDWQMSWRVPLDRLDVLQNGILGPNRSRLYGKR
jgi:hypothetical protein